MDSLTFQSIYAHLLEGKRLTLSFPSAETAETFRVKMAKYKTAQEELCAIVDMKVGSEEKKFSFYLDIGERSLHYIAEFTKRPNETHYEVLAIENPPEV